MRALRVAAAFLLACFVPPIAFAQTTSNPELSTLLSELNALEQQIAALSGTSSTAASAPAASPVPDSYSGICPDLTENLSLGQSGSDVSNLQAFLAGQGLFNASITGYYGTITQSAVQEWQSSHGVVAGGTPATTGFGNVGPATRAAIDASCGYGTQQSQCQQVQPPSTECSTGWQPVADQNGCTEYYQCAIPLPTASSTTSVATSSSSQACPVVQKPVCTGSVVPFQTNSNGCVTSYECEL